MRVCYDIHIVGSKTGNFKGSHPFARVMCKVTTAAIRQLLARYHCNLDRALKSLVLGLSGYFGSLFVNWYFYYFQASRESRYFCDTEAGTYLVFCGTFVTLMSSDISSFKSLLENVLHYIHSRSDL